MTRICAWCGKRMNPGDPRDGRITHGCCEQCQVGVRAEIAALAADQERQASERGKFRKRSTGGV